ncbi:MAG TPA: hypothetical protein IAA78_02495 [Candidatus Avamphibacillus intestinigallinarum]|nr:hypothetical protein [Candidatus Avamphibacillus intestinigallinarum]
MKHFLLTLSMGMIIIFGGGFLIRFIRDSEFYIAEFIVGIIGIILFIVGLRLDGTANSKQ